jgi:hypothetical protein
MATTPYNYINQSIAASCLIQPKDIDSFYNPTSLSHTGFAWDGTLYAAGVQQPGPVYASWYTEGASAFRGSLATFPQSGIVLLSNTALTIIDGSTFALNMWMIFLFQNVLVDPTSETPGGYALVNNFNSEFNGWSPAGLSYADGIVSAVYTPDYGNESGPSQDNTSYDINSNMVINIDFSQDQAYLDVAVQPPSGPIG